ncbi:MAG: HAD family hydrolase [Bacteroidales bacterium]|nr:HAD family hydrolase [Bacteroidales bacterium]
MSIQKNIYSGVFFIDLDGTLLNSDKKIGKKDRKTLNDLGKKNYLRVFATGRTYFSAHQVIDETYPFDYLIFSSGAGIKNMKTGELIYKTSLNLNQINETIKVLQNLNVNFSIQHPIPDNHIYHFHKGKKNNTDFEWRNDLYKKYAYSLNSHFPLNEATQFLVILESEEKFNKVKGFIKDLKVIRATSPIDGKSIWLEIFPQGVSKAAGAKFLCDSFAIPKEKTIGIGNDYNDLDLLAWTHRSFVVENAPEILKNKYETCVDNENNPLTDVVLKQQILK